MTTPARLVTAAVTLGAALCLAGCGGNAAAANSSKQANDAQMLKFAQCMRDHGVQVSDPGSGQGNGVYIQAGGNGPNSNVTQDQLQQAQQACQKYMPNGGQGPGQLDQKKKDALLKYAQCMRQHGVNMPDPQFDSSGRVSMTIGGGSGQSVDPNSPTYQQAQQACQHFMTDAGMGAPGLRSGSGSSGGGASIKTGNG